jgi:SNF2 family DNA or RNA helicase
MTIRARKEPRLDVKLTAFDYQSNALEFVRDLEYAAVFHEQGLGKTKIAIDVLLWWLDSKSLDSVIIVTKLGLIENWKRELRSHTFIEPRILGQDKAANFRAFNSPARVYLTHYETFVSDKKRLQLFLRTRDVGIILDEAQKIKTPTTGVAEALFELRELFKRRLIVTGTPVANRPQDIWSQIFFLDGGAALGRSFDAFKARVNLGNSLSWNSQKREQFEQALVETSEAIRPFAIRETKESAGLALPKKTIESKPVPLEARQQELYDAYCRELSSVVVRNGIPVLDDVDVILKRLTRLIQIASNPQLVDQSYVNVPGKLGPLKQIVGSSVDRGEKVIVWTGFIDNAEFLKRELSRHGSTAVHGALALEERNKALDLFKMDDNCRVLIATPGSAKEGLTLTVANNAVFYDRSLSLDDYLQAQDRIHRISQTKDCHIVNLIAEGTVDEWVEALLNAKRTSARLAQGDIDRPLFVGEISYDYGEILRQILDAARQRSGR